jgi:hypothetical protein
MNRRDLLNVTTARRQDGEIHYNGFYSCIQDWSV